MILFSFTLKPLMKKCRSYHFCQVPHLVFAVLNLSPTVVDLLWKTKMFKCIQTFVEKKIKISKVWNATTITFLSPCINWVSRTSSHSTLHVINQQKDSLLVCEAHLAAEVDTPSGSSSPSFWIPVKCLCGHMRPAEAQHPDPVVWRDAKEGGNKKTLLDLCCCWLLRLLC